MWQQGKKSKISHQANRDDIVFRIHSHIRNVEPLLDYRRLVAVASSGCNRRFCRRYEDMSSHWYRPSPSVALFTSTQIDPKLSICQISKCLWNADDVDDCGTWKTESCPPRESGYSPCWRMFAMENGAGSCTDVSVVPRPCAPFVKRLALSSDLRPAPRYHSLGTAFSFPAYICESVRVWVKWFGVQPQTNFVFRSSFWAKNLSTDTLGYSSKDMSRVEAGLRWKLKIVTFKAHLWVWDDRRPPNCEQDDGKR